MPPLALLMDDASRLGKYAKWDLKLIKAFHINEAFDINGHPPWVEESPDIIWKAKTKTLRSAKVVDAEQSRLQKSNANTDGVQVMAVPTLRPGAKWPTRQAWSDRIRLKPDLDEDTKLSRVAREQDERARIKLEQMLAEENA